MGEADPRTDAELVAAVRGGDEGAFAALYHRHRDWVVRLAYRFTADHDDALDVLQETFVYLVRKAPALHLTASMRTFLYPAVKNLSIAVRRKRRRLVLGEDELLQQQPGPQTPEQSELAAALRGLSELHREVVLMRFVDEMSLDEIATALRLPVGTVKSRLHNALRTLRDDPGARRYFQP